MKHTFAFNYFFSILIQSLQLVHMFAQAFNIRLTILGEAIDENFFQKEMI